MVILSPDQDELMIKITYKLKHLIELMHDHPLSDEEADKVSKEIWGIVWMIYWLWDKAPYYIHTLYQMSGYKIPIEIVLAICSEMLLKLYKHNLVIIKDIQSDWFKDDLLTTENNDEE